VLRVERGEDPCREVGRAAPVDELEQRVQVGGAVGRERGGGVRGEPRRAQAPPAPLDEVAVVDLDGPVFHRTGVGDGGAAILTPPAAASDNLPGAMRPLSSPVRDHRVLGRVQVIVGAVFVIFAGALNPVEAGFGLLVAMPVTAAILYLAVFRPVSRRLLRHPPSAPTSEHEDPGSFARRMRWPVAAQVALFLALAGLARAPGLLGGIAVGVGVALLLTARWLEGWENEHEVGLLYEPGGAREGRGGYYVARGARRR
jgi:hypothetical protein